MQNTGYTGSITIVPEYLTLSKDFSALLDAAVAAKQPTLVYNNTTFVIDQKDGVWADIKVVLDDLHASLPDAFDGDNVTIDHVDLRCDIPPRLLAKPGWYVGENFGLLGSYGCVDPQGINGESIIFVRGDIYPNVIKLFRLIMSGELEPGYDDDLFSRYIYNPMD